VEEKLKKALDLLSETETIGGWHVLASFQPWKNDNLIDQSKYFDTLARLFVEEREKAKKRGKGKQKKEAKIERSEEAKEEKKGDICIAVCYDKERKRLLVASNQNQPQSAED